MRKLLLALLFFAFTQPMFGQNCPPSSDPSIHIIQKGQTYYRLSKLYNISVDQILSMNGRTVNDVLSICDAIRVAPSSGVSSTPTTTTTAPTSGGTIVSNAPINTGTPPGRYSKPYSQYQKQVKGVHYAEEDENLAGIAFLYGYSPERFREFNGMNAGEEIITGQVLRTTDCACLNTITDDEDDKVVVTGYTGKRDRLTGGTSGNTNSGGSTTSPPVNTGNRSSGTSNGNNSGNSSIGGGSGSTQPNTGATAGNPTASASYMKTEELLMLDEINLIRANPSGYIPYVQQYISHLQKNGSFGNSIQTARELILELQKTPALSILEPRECVYNAARKHGADEKRMGRSDHMGSDGSWPWDRVLRECPSLQDGNENLVGGPDDIRRAVMLLLVDDGIPNRGHRKTLLNPSWKYAACYKVGMIGSMPNSWVQNFAY